MDSPISLAHLSQLINDYHISDGNPTSTDYLAFIGQVIQLASLPESKNDLSFYGRNFSLMWTSAQGLHYASVAKSPLQGSFSEDRKAFWLDIGYKLTFLTAGTELLRNVSATSEVSDIAATVGSSVAVLTRQDLDLGAVGSSLSFTTTMAFAGYNFWNYQYLSDLAKSLNQTETTAEKVANVSGLLSSGISLTKVGLSMAGLGKAAFALSAIAGTLGAVRFVASKVQAYEEARYPLYGVKKDLVKIVDEMFVEATKSVSAENKDERRDIKETYITCKRRIEASTNEQELDFAMFLVGTVMGSMIGRGGNDSLIGRYESVKQRFVNEVAGRHQVIGEKLVLLNEYKGFLDHELDMLNTVLGDGFEESSLNIVERYRRSEILEMSARIMEEISRIDALVQSPPQELAINRWMDEVNFLCSNSHRQEMVMKIQACQEEPELFDIIHI